MDDETVLPDAWAEVDVSTDRLGDAVDSYLEGVDERELGGVWWLDGMSRVAVSFTSRVDEHRKALEALLGNSKVVVLTATYSEAELSALVDQVGDDMERGQGPPITHVATNVEANRVEVGVPVLSQETRAEVHRRWPHPAVTVTEGMYLRPADSK